MMDLPIILDWSKYWYILKGDFLLTREQIEKRECEILAPYAVKSGDSEGRDREEPLHKYRTHFQRDRDRVIYCSSFRRLEYKTQVFVNHQGDNYRTRLTHTMEVAQIARTIARTMSLNEDFVEALGLAHDLGHPPFGHAGEEQLNELMKDDGGFEHNWQSRRIVKILENNFHGLNLTKEVSESIVKHKTVYDNSNGEVQGTFLETQVVNLADEISYNCHDLDDGISAGILSSEGLEELEVWQMGKERVDAAFPELKGSHRTKRIIVSILDIYVSDLIDTSENNLKSEGISSVEEVIDSKKSLISFSENIHKINNVFQEYLCKHLYKHSQIMRMSHKAKQFIRKIFQEYEKHPDSIPEDYQEWSLREGVGLKRALADYIAGMTDRYAQDEYMKLFYPYK